jgi:spore coat protein A, manganese oxidase
MKRIATPRVTRRDFLRSGSLLAAAAAFPGALTAGANRIALDPNTLARFVDPLPVPGRARPSGVATTQRKGVVIPHYRIAATAFDAQVHRDLKPTRMWGFGGTFPGPTFDLHSGENISVEWANDLPQQHFLPIDHTLHGAEVGQPEVRVVSHLHGGRVPAGSDGYPDNWLVPGKSAVYQYPNQQDAAMLWYHDHAMGINRLNIFAGLAGAYIVRDKVEESLRLPSGKYEIPLIIADRMFDRDAQLYYPVAESVPDPWLPEFFGNANLVNGKLFPFLEVEPRKYRFRVLNASNARFYGISLSTKQMFQQIGTDQGLLPAPASARLLTIAPAERVDLIIDFKDHAGTNVLLNDGVVPLLQFRVSSAGVKDDTSLPDTLRPVTKLQESDASKTRMLSLDEVDDRVQRPMKMLLDNKGWSDPVSENPRLNSTEIWSFINPTEDAHPIHLHLVRFQILDRQKIEDFAYARNRQLKFQGPRVLPSPDEAGWKDTVRAEPKMLTRIIVPFEGYSGRYVWHCHILEHEDNEMMRPYDVLPPT